jgi:hypothetical protein
MRHKFVYIILIVLLAGGVIAGVVGYYSASTQLSKVQAKMAVQKKDERVLTFLKMFIKKVIKSESGVSFEDRLALENSVRNLNDKDILAQWKKFVDSKTEKEAQDNTKDLLDLLVNKVSK